MLRKAANLVWKLTRWFTGVIILFFVAYAANFAVLKRNDVASTYFVSLVNWLFLPGFNRIITLSIIVPLFTITLLSGILAREEKDNKLSVSENRSRYRQQMIERVRTIWITGVLDGSLHGAVLIALGLKEQQDAIANPWRFVFYQSNLSERPLPAGTSIIEVYNESGGELLILGEPGSGKTTLLLSLTSDLLERAKGNRDLPIPVVFNISSWATARHQNLAEWIVEELNIKYQVPLAIGQLWIKHDEVQPLLDGLDEMNANDRPRCIDAINAYHKEHMVPIVLCSRKAEYFAQSNRVELRNAVVVQPLTTTQIDNYLSMAGNKLTAVREALREDRQLRALATTPLMLSILTLTYQGRRVEELRMKGSLEQRRQQIFATYVQRMLERRGISSTYAPQQTVYWLTWIAHMLVQYNQVGYSWDLLQLNWFPIRRVFKLVYMLSGIFLIGLLVALLVSWPFGLAFGILAGLRSGLFFSFILIRSLFKDSTLFNLELVSFDELSLLDVMHVFIGGGRLIVLKSYFTRNYLLTRLDLYVMIVGGIIFGWSGFFLGGLFVAVEVFILISWFLSLRTQFPKFFSISEFINMIRPQGRYKSLFSQLLIGLLSGILFGLISNPLGGLISALLVLLFNGGGHFLLYYQCHIIIRLLLWLTGYMPLRQDKFFDYVSSRILIRKVGKSYIFIHRLLLEYFASLYKIENNIKDI